MFKQALTVGLLVGVIMVAAFAVSSGLSVKQPLTTNSVQLQHTVDDDVLQPATVQLQGNNDDTARLQPTVMGTELQ